VRITISKENYLKAIAEAQAEDQPVIAATLARWLEVSPPAVTMAIRRLRRDSCITVDKKGHIHLTAEGRKIADRILRRHHLIERMLVEIFGMEWFKVHDEAERLEHAVSADFEQLLERKLGADLPCPHGNEVEVVPLAHRRKLGWLPLDEAAESSRVTVVSVYERDRKLLEYLDGLSVQPGATLRVVRRNYDETLTFQIDGNSVQLANTVAHKVWVKEQLGVGAVETRA